MPLPCLEGELEDEKFSHNEAISRAVVEVVKQGMEEDRVTCDIHNCSELMKCPESVMLCLLVQLSATLDAAIKIPLLLIRAFCQENAIDLLHVQGQDKMAQLLSTCLSQSAKCTDDVTKPPVKEENGADLGCIMIKYPKRDTSFEDDMVADYIKEKVQNHSDPSVTLPDLTTAGVDKTMGFKLKIKKTKAPVQASS